MNLLRKSNSSAADSEYDMQDAVSQIMATITFQGQTPTGGDTWNPALNVYREVSIRRIGRISDIIVEITPRKIVNIECKLFDYTGVINQALDHKRWADYSYICMHAQTLLPAYAIKKMIDNDLGLMLWSKERGLLDVIGAGHNTYKSGDKDRATRKIVTNILQKSDPISPRSPIQQ